MRMANKVGLVTDIGGLNDRGFNHLAYVGLQRAASQLGVQVKVLTSTGANDYVPNLSSLAKDGYNLVIGVGFLQEQAIQQVAKAFPNTKFAGVDMNAETDFQGGISKNFEGLIFQENQVGYEVGYLAGLEAKRLGKTAVSSVGGIPVPPVVRYIAGFQAGAKAAFPGVKTLNGYSQDFVAQDKCKEVALNQIQGGSDVVFQVAGQCGLGALTALRVFVLIALASLVWVPIGVYVGLRPRVARVVQPVAQFLAAFPANLLFPVAVAVKRAGSMVEAGFAAPPAACPPPAAVIGNPSIFCNSIPARMNGPTPLRSFSTTGSLR